MLVDSFDSATPGRKGRPAKFGRAGFTLIELLVVVAIIALLAAILFPVFSQVRQKARQTTCASNLHQLGMGVMQYTQDNDEYLPMSDYMNGSCAEIANSALQPYIKSQQLLLCPGNTNPFNPQALLAILGKTACADVPAADNYDLNNKVLANPLIPLLNETPVAVASLTEPSLTVSAYDGNVDSNLNLALDQVVQAVHSNTVEMVFADAHVKAAIATQTGTDTKYDATSLTAYTLAANPYGCSAQTSCQVLPP